MPERPFAVRRQTAPPKVTATATCSALSGVDESGEHFSSSQLGERVVLALDLVERMGLDLLRRCWDERHLALLATDLDKGGRELPAKGYMAMRRLGWVTEKLPGIVVPDRFRRCVEESVARQLRQALHRRTLVQAICATWPERWWQRNVEEQRRLDAALPEGAATVEVRNRTRQIAAFVGERGHMPQDLCELEPEVRMGRTLLLAAADRQLVELERVEDTARLRVKLPRTAAPAAYGDWPWVTMDAWLPPTVPEAAKPCTPTLRVVEGRVRMDLPFEVVGIPHSPSGHERALGVDWGVNTFLTASLGKLVEGTVVTDGRPLVFDAAGISVKLERLRRESEAIAKKMAHLERLVGGRDEGDPRRRQPEAKLERLKVEHEHLGLRRRRLGRALAWSGARWLVDQAHALAATAIYVEDLATLEPRGRSASTRVRISSAVRGELFSALRHLGLKEGVAVVMVPARGTSAGCPRCQGALHHVAAPNRLRDQVWKWAHCPRCGLSLDRDHAASQRVLGRGLLSQDRVEEDAAGRLFVGEGRDAPVRRARRRKKKPHPRPRTHTRKSTPPAAPAGSPDPGPHRDPRFPAQQRPAGRMPQGGGDAAGQAPTKFPYPRHRPGPDSHRPAFARLGRGFHRHVQASAVIIRGDWYVRERPRHAQLR